MRVFVTLRRDLYELKDAAELPSSWDAHDALMRTYTAIWVFYGRAKAQRFIERFRSRHDRRPAGPWLDHLPDWRDREALDVCINWIEPRFRP